MVKSKGRVSANFHCFKFERKVEIRISGLRYFFLRREVQKNVSNSDNNSNSDISAFISHSAS